MAGKNVETNKINDINFDNKQPMSSVEIPALNLSAADAAFRAAAIQSELETYVNPEKREYLPRFFKTGKGEYGEGDQFLGIVVPDVRRVAKAHKDEPLPVAKCLLKSPWHECRLCALLMLVERFKKAAPEERKEIVYFYMDHTDRINNWDLVDLSAPYIIGEFIEEALKHSDTYRKFNARFSDYYKSPSIWEQRIGIVSNLPLIRRGDFSTILVLFPNYLSWNALSSKPGAKPNATRMHDLNQKAMGWMLREMGKHDERFLKALLDSFARRMPRTMLRYAIEKLSPEERKEYMER